jgi:hypothetical protein
MRMLQKLGTEEQRSHDDIAVGLVGWGMQRRTGEKRWMYNGREGVVLRHARRAGPPMATERHSSSRRQWWVCYHDRQ